MQSRPMKLGLGLGVALAALTLAARPASSGLGTSFNAYFRLDGDANQVVGVQVAPDGAITELTGSPYQSGNSSVGDSRDTGSLAISRKRKTLFIGGGNGVGAAKIGADGSLTTVSGSPFGSAPANGLAVAEIGKNTFVYASDTASSLINIFKASNSGTLSRSGRPVFMPGARGIAVAKRRIFFALSNGSFVVCKLKENGALAPLPGYPKATGLATIDQVRPTSDGSLVYISGDDGSIRGYKLNSKGKASKITGSPFAVNGSFTGAVLPLSKIGARFTGATLVSEADSPDLVSLRRAKDGRLIPTNSTGQLTIDGQATASASPDGLFYVVATDAPGLGTVHINASTGIVTPGQSLARPGLTQITGAVAYRP